MTKVVFVLCVQGSGLSFASEALGTALKAVEIDSCVIQGNKAQDKQYKIVSDAPHAHFPCMATP